MSVKLTHAQVNCLRIIRGFTDRNEVFKKSHHAWMPATYDMLVSRHLIELVSGTSDTYRITEKGRDFLK